jgi:hypothetical protein
VSGFSSVLKSGSDLIDCAYGSFRVQQWNEKGQIETLQEHQKDASFNSIPWYPI